MCQINKKKSNFTSKNGRSLGMTINNIIYNVFIRVQRSIATTTFVPLWSVFHGVSINLNSYPWNYIPEFLKVLVQQSKATQ